MSHDFNRHWDGPHLDRVAMPMGGIGAGMIALEGAGKLGQCSFRHAPAVFHEPYAYAALAVEGSGARLLEGPVPAWKAAHPWGDRHEDSGTGGRGRTYGLPRFATARFACRFPFGTVDLGDPTFPVAATLTGWSPFIPLDSDASSLPVAAVEYALRNTSGRPLKAVFSFHARQFMHGDPRHHDPRRPDARPPTVDRTPHGFTFHAAGFDDAPWAEGHAAIEAAMDDAAVAVDTAWFRGGWFDAQTVLWRDVAAGRVIDRPPHATGRPSDGGSLYIAFELAPGQERTVRLRLSWYVPRSSLGLNLAKGWGHDTTGETYVPWYAGRFDSLDAVREHWRAHYDELKRRTRTFTDAFYDTTLPPEAVEAAAANLAILKSPTVLRQADGRLWAWEGCFDAAGCCPGSCTHVWNYAQALPHLFPDLERSLRETEFEVAQASEGAGEKAGHQAFRVCLPIAEPPHDHHAAADGQLGGIIKAYRDWRIAGDTDWLRRLWPRIKQGLAYCIRAWDPDHTGLPHRPHHNTYDIEFWGPNGMIGSFYLAALGAAVAMGEALGDVDPLWRTLLQRGRAAMENDLFNGEYFVQKIDRDAGERPRPDQTPEAVELFEREGPKYQYGDGCLADGVLGFWMAEVAGLDWRGLIDPQKVAAHLDAVFRHNFKATLATHANTQRPTYALGDEAGLLLCTWPRGGRLTLPFPYADEVWTGIEYQAASHLMRMGRVDEGLAIVRAARRRYDGTKRNPFDEIECGHWYARAMASYALIQGLAGVRYDAVERTLYVAPAIEPPFTSFLCTARGFGKICVDREGVRVEVAAGEIAVDRVVRAGGG